MPGKANPAPPVGPALAGAWDNIMASVRNTTPATTTRSAKVIPAEITIFTGWFLHFHPEIISRGCIAEKAAGIEKGSSEPNRTRWVRLPFTGARDR